MKIKIKYWFENSLDDVETNSITLLKKKLATSLVDLKWNYLNEKFCPLKLLPSVPYFLGIYLKNNKGLRGKSTDTYAKLMKIS